MAKYKVNAVAFLNNNLVHEGDVIEFDDRVGIPGPYMELVDAPTTPQKVVEDVPQEPLV